MKRKNIAYFILAIILLFTTLVIAPGREHVYLSSVNKARQSHAEIRWRKVFLGVDASLYVINSNSTIIFQQKLLQNRDAFADIKNEIISLNWEGDNVVLKVERNHYDGPITLPINFPNQ